MVVDVLITGLVVRDWAGMCGVVEGGIYGDGIWKVGNDGLRTMLLSIPLEATLTDPFMYNAAEIATITKAMSMTRASIHTTAVLVLSVDMQTSSESSLMVSRVRSFRGQSFWKRSTQLGFPRCDQNGSIASNFLLSSPSVSRVL